MVSKVKKICHERDSDSKGGKADTPLHIIKQDRFEFKGFNNRDDKKEYCYKIEKIVNELETKVGDKYIIENAIKLENL